MEIACFAATPDLTKSLAAIVPARPSPPLQWTRTRPLLAKMDRNFLERAGWTCWTATRDSYLGRVPKALIVEAVREDAGTRTVGQIAVSKKEIMVADAGQLLAGTGWLPLILRVSEASHPVDFGDTDSLTIQPMSMATG